MYFENFEITYVTLKNNKTINILSFREPYIVVCKDRGIHPGRDS